MSERPAHTANRATGNPLKLGETVQIRKNPATGRIPKSRAHGNDTKSVASGISFIEGELAPYLTALWGRGSMGELTEGAPCGRGWGGCGGESSTRLWGRGMDGGKNVMASKQFVADFEAVALRYNLRELGEYEAAKEAARRDLENAEVCFAAMAREAQ